MWWFKVASSKYQVTSKRTVLGFFLLLVTFHLMLVLQGCGFHLRSFEKTEFPASLAQMRVSLDDDPSLHVPIVAAVKQALLNVAEVTVVESGGDAVPHLKLSSEQFVSQVLSVTSDAKVSEYLLKYEVSYRLYAADGKSLSKRRTVKMQRDYTFDRLNVLAKQREENELRARLRNDAARQIVWHLAKLPLGETTEH